MKRIFKVILCLMMVFGCVSVFTYNVSAASGTALTSDISGTSLTAGDYYLSEDVSLSDSITVESGEVTIDLNGYTLTKTGATNYFISVKEGGTLTIKDSSEAQSGSIEISGTYYSICVFGGTLNLESGSLMGVNMTAGYTGTFNMNGGTIQNVEDGVNVCGNQTFNMSGGTITNCSKQGVYVKAYAKGNGTFNMSGGTITNNGATTSKSHYGGGIYAKGSTSSTGLKLVLTGGTIANNTACFNTNTASYGGNDLALYLTASTTYTITIDGINDDVVYTGDSYGLKVDGLYNDAKNARYSSTNISEVTSIESGNDYFLIAAHGDVYTVTFTDGVDGEVFDSETIYVTSSIVPSFSGSLSRVGYVFKGWSTDGTTVIDLTTVSSDTTYIAVWEECNHEDCSSKVLTEATCTTDGEIQYTCNDCGYVWTEVLTATGHNYYNEGVLNYSIEWLKTDDGYNAIAYLYCVNCDEYITIECDVTSETITASDDRYGYTLYIASFTYDDITYTSEYDTDYIYSESSEVEEESTTSESTSETTDTDSTTDTSDQTVMMLYAVLGLLAISGGYTVIKRRKEN